MLRKLSIICFSLLFFSLISCRGSGSKDGTGVKNQTSYKIITVTTNKFTGALGASESEAISEADNHCAAEFGTAYKALLSSQTVRNLSVDWVLQPNTEYRRNDRTTVIGTTNASGTFDFDLKNAITSDFSSVWTGFNSEWKISHNCHNWTNGSAAGYSGRGDKINSVSISANNIHCTNFSNSLYCVEQ